VTSNIDAPLIHDGESDDPAAGGGTLRVCHVIHSLRAGGAEHLLLTLAEAGPEVGLDVSVLSLMPTEGVLYAQRLRELGTTVRTLELPTRWDPRGLQRGVRTIRELQPQVVHTHLKHADLIGAYASRHLGTPMVSTLHLIEDARSPVVRSKRWLAAQARLRTAARTIAVSDAQRAWYLATFKADPSTVVTVRNGVTSATRSTVTERARVQRAFGVPGHGILIVTISLLRPGKGHQDLFAALRQLPEELDLQVLVAGDGPLRQHLEGEVAVDTALREHVRFVGFVEDVPDLLAAADIIVQPSHFDALPTALIYALSAGIPAIATRVGGIPEIVGDDAGLLVPVGDAPALAAAIRRLATDPALRTRMGDNARQRFDREFDVQIWARRLREVYSSVLSEAQR
jgi:glycosyltransferase involved in cell wall biosynthesis